MPSIRSIVQQIRTIGNDIRKKQPNASTTDGSIYINRLIRTITNEILSTWKPSSTSLTTEERKLLFILVTCIFLDREPLHYDSVFTYFEDGVSFNFVVNRLNYKYVSSESGCSKRQQDLRLRIMYEKSMIGRGAEFASINFVKTYMEYYSDFTSDIKSNTGVSQNILKAFSAEDMCTEYGRLTGCAVWQKEFTQTIVDNRFKIERVWLVYRGGPKISLVFPYGIPPSVILVAKLVYHSPVTNVSTRILLQSNPFRRESPVRSTQPEGSPSVGSSEEAAPPPRAEASARNPLGPFVPRTLWGVPVTPASEVRESYEEAFKNQARRFILVPLQEQKNIYAPAQKSVGFTVDDLTVYPQSLIEELESVLTTEGYKVTITDTSITVEWPEVVREVEVEDDRLRL